MPDWYPLEVYFKIHDIVRDSRSWSLLIPSQNLRRTERKSSASKCEDILRAKRVESFYFPVLPTLRHQPGIMSDIFFS